MELTPEENAALVGVEAQLVAVLGDDATAVINSIHDRVNGVETAKEKEPVYGFWEDAAYFFDETERYNSDHIANPRWEEMGDNPMHDWRAYIPDELIQRWETLSQETKEVAHYIAEKQANSERWD